MADRVSWDNALDFVGAWHRERRPRVGRAVFGFLEVELRLMMPQRVKASWPKDRVEDVLRDVLAQLVERTLPEGVRDLRRYLRRTLRNRCIDLMRATKRRPAEPHEPGAEALDQVSVERDALSEAVAKQTRETVSEGLATLKIEDRVALKLDLAPEWMSLEELEWLAARTRLGVDEVLRRVVEADGVYELSKIMDPGDDAADDREARRKRLDRFLKRRDRAGGRLLAALGQVRP